MSNRWNSTQVEARDALYLWPLQAFVFSALDKLQWRWSGLGLLQAYVLEDPPRGHAEFGRQAGGRGRELRIHIWSKKLLRDGIDRNGNVHNHRFSMCSTVLCGSIRHDEYQISGNPEGRFVLWDFPNADAQTAEERCAMRPLVGRYDATVAKGFLEAGQQYTFARGAYHRSYPLVDPTVTLVEKYDQYDYSARVLAPHDTEPVSAFGGKADAATVVAIVLDAKERLAALLKERP